MPELTTGETFVWKVEAVCSEMAVAEMAAVEIVEDKKAEKQSGVKSSSNHRSLLREFTVLSSSKGPSVGRSKFFLIL